MRWYINGKESTESLLRENNRLLREQNELLRAGVDPRDLRQVAKLVSGDIGGRIVGTRAMP